MTFLFGNAISIDIPDGYIDASNFRPIPSHQEVFLDSNSDSSLIIEILEMADAPIDNMAEYHLRQVCDSIVNVKVESLETALEANASLAHGNINDLQITMIVFRLDRFKTDLLLTWNSKDSIKSRMKALASTLIVLDSSLFL